MKLGAAVDKLSWQYQTGHFRALGFDFRVRTLDARLGAYLGGVFSPLAAGSYPAARLYSVVSGETVTSGRHHLYLDGLRVGRPPTTRDTVSVLLWHVNREAIRSVPDHLVVHAAAAEYGGNAILFPAAMEAGKTTLVAGLVRAGFGYVTDEAAAIEPGSARLLPYPKALSVERGSWSVLPELEPHPDPALAGHLPAQWQVDPRSIRPDAIAAPCVVRMVIATRYRPEGPTLLEPMGRADAVMALAENSFNLTEHGSEGFEALARLVRDCRCYRLFVGDLPAACALLVDLVQGSAG